MKSRQIVKELDRIARGQERIEAAAQSLATVLESAIDYIDVLEGSQEEEVVGEVLVESATGEETHFLVAKPPIKPGTVTLYRDGTVVDPQHYTIKKNAAVVPTVAIPEGSKLTVDYTYRGERADVVDAAADFEGLSLAELKQSRADYQTALQWIDQHLV